MPVDDDAIGSTLLASRALIGVAARSLSKTESDLTLGQYRALVLLNTRGPQIVGALADALGIHPSTATRLCDRLLAKGLIERTPSPVNRREVTVALSGKGRAIVRDVATRRRREIRRIVAKLDRATQRKLVDAFDAFADAAGELPDDAWKLGWTS
jgi:DNA-binding MarR family transcriptional regulator